MRGSIRLAARAASGNIFLDRAVVVTTGAPAGAPTCRPQA